MLKLKDNTQNPKELFDTIPNLTEKLADKSLKQLEKEGVFVFSDTLKNAEDLSDEQYILKHSDGKYYTSNLMGFVGYKKEYLAISSRFSLSDNDCFLKYLLECVLKFPSILNIDTTLGTSSYILDLFTFLFPRYLKNAVRKGIFKSYVHNEYNDCNVKGNIDIKRHIRLNTPFLGRIAYNQREFSYDNYLTQLIRHTVEAIKRRADSRYILSEVKEEIAEIIGCTPSYKPGNIRKIIEINKRTPIKHAYFSEYKKLQWLCLLILQHERCQIGSGVNEIYGVIFDGSWLWEEYVYSLVKEYFYHPNNRTGEGAQRLFSGSHGLIYPDFIGKDDKNRIIADAKYKPVENIANKDYLQLVAYMYRFDASSGYYFYPESHGKISPKLSLNQGSTYEKNVSARDNVFVKKCGLVIPTDTQSYDEFKRLMKKNEREFVSAITGLQ